MAILINNVSADTTSEEYKSSGGKLVANIRGDFDSTTVVLEVASLSDPTEPKRFITLTDGSFTSPASVTLNYIPVGMAVRSTVTAGAGTNIFVELLQ